jgi:hypothetical protein
MSICLPCVYTSLSNGDDSLWLIGASSCFLWCQVGVTIYSKKAGQPISVVEQYVSTAKSRNLGNGDANSHWTVEQVEAFWQPGVVSTMAVNESAPGLQIYLGGFFSKAGETPVGNLMTFDGESYKALAPASYSQNPPVGGFSLSSIVILGNYAYIGGDFLTFSSDNTNTDQQTHTIDVTSLARYDAVSAQWYNVGLNRLRVGNQTDAMVNSMAVFPDGRTIAVTGFFQVEVEGGEVVRNVVAYDTVEDRFLKLGPTFGTADNPYCHPMAVAVDANSNVYIGGCLVGADVCVRRLSSAHGAAANWTTVGRFSVNTNGKLGKVRVTAIDCQGSSHVYVGGLFDQVHNVGTGFMTQAPNIAVLDLHTMEWFGLDQGTDGLVSVIKYHDTTEALYIGGEFTVWFFVVMWVDVFFFFFCFPCLT